MSDIFDRGLKLFSGIIYETINEYSTFTHIKSVFNDEWYNFIVPEVDPDKLDSAEVRRVVDAEAKRGVSLSYYISDALHNQYKTFFEGSSHLNTSTDYYICNQHQNIYKPSGELILVDDSTIDAYVSMSRTCFPDWASNESYARHMYRHQKANQEKIVLNYLLKDNDNYVGFCGFIGSKKENLAYFHNTGVLPEYRRKGYFTAIIQHLINLTITSGITKSYALVENNSGSYHGLIKIGYKVEEKYHLFSI
ncbi:MAG: GNAT family N-acetyltransferase [Microgenomates group bacterium]